MGKYGKILTMCIQKRKFWEMTLKAQWDARREFQKQNWEFKEVPPELVKKVANGLVSHAVTQLKKIKKEIKDLNIIA